MKGILSFTAGFVVGWLARSTANSSRDAAVGLLAFGQELSERVRRVAAIERKRLDDLAAEARARVDAFRAKRASRVAQNVDSAA